MADSSVAIPHFKVPFNISDGAAEVVEQDSDDDIIQCVEAICRTPRGFRIESPEFGIDEVVLRENGPDRDKLQRTITYWEPRVRMAINIQDPSVLDRLHYLVEINVGGVF